MARTLYVLPALSNMDSSPVINGFSSSSGGAPLASVTVGVGDTVIFDANSGPSRTITTAGGNVSMAALSITPDAASFTINGPVSVYTTVTLNAGAVIGTLNGNGANTANGGNGSGITLTCNGGLVRNYNNSNGNLSLGGPANFISADFASFSFVTNNYDVTSTQLYSTGSSSGYNWNLGTSKITMNCSLPDSNSIMTCWNLGNRGTVAGSPSFIFNITSSGASAAMADIGAFNSKTNVAINCVGSGAALFSVSQNINSLTLRGNLYMASGIGIGLGSLSVDGNGCYGGVARISLNGSPSSANFNVSSANNTYLDRVKAVGIGFFSTTGKFFYSRSDQGSDSAAGFQKIPANARFIPFL